MLFPNPKAGDEVAYYRSYRDEPRKLTIDRVTPARIVVRGTQFRRTDGGEVGGSRWSRTWVKPWTPDIDEALAKAAEDKRRAEHLVEVRNRGRAAMTLLGSKELDEAQAQAAEDLVRELEQRVTDIMSRESAPASFEVPSAEGAGCYGLDASRTDAGVLNVGVGHDRTKITLTSARAFAAALWRMAAAEDLPSAPDDAP